MILCLDFGKTVINGLIILCSEFMFPSLIHQTVELFKTVNNLLTYQKRFVHVWQEKFHRTFYHPCIYITTTSHVVFPL